MNKHAVAAALNAAPNREVALTTGMAAAVIPAIAMLAQQQHNRILGAYMRRPTYGSPHSIAATLTLAYHHTSTAAQHHAVQRLRRAVEGAMENQPVLSILDDIMGTLEEAFEWLDEDTRHDAVDAAMDEFVHVAFDHAHFESASTA